MSNGTESVRDHFAIHYACFKDQGPCVEFHATHIHVSLYPDFHDEVPRCDGGTAGWDPPGSPGILAFRDEVYRRFPGVHAPGPGLGVFDCRPIAGTTHWSDHAYGNAVDIAGQDDLLWKVWAWINGAWEEEDLASVPQEEWDTIRQQVGEIAVWQEDFGRGLGGEPEGLSPGLQAGRNAAFARGYRNCVEGIERAVLEPDGNQYRLAGWDTANAEGRFGISRPAGGSTGG